MILRFWRMVTGRLFRTLKSIKFRFLPPSNCRQCPPNVSTNYRNGATYDAVNVLLLDCLNTKPLDKAYVRQHVIKYLKEVTPGTRLAVFILGNQIGRAH